MYTKKQYPGAVELCFAHEFIRIEAWGRNALRVRIGPSADFPQGLGALEAGPATGLGSMEEAKVTEVPGYDTPEEVFTNGRISVVANLDGGTGIARFLLDFQKDGESVLR